MMPPSRDSIDHRLQRLENQSLALSASLQRLYQLIEIILAKIGDRYFAEIGQIERELQALKTLSPLRTPRS